MNAGRLSLDFASFESRIHAEWDEDPSAHMLGSFPLRSHVKLAAAHVFLDGLKQLQNTYGQLASAPRLVTDLLLDSFLYHLVGAKDAVLYEANQALNLDIPDKEVCQARINLTLPNNAGMKPLNEISGDKKSWFWEANNFRNKAAHRSILHFAHAQKLGVGQGPARTYLVNDTQEARKGRTDLEVVPYCEDRLQKMRSLVQAMHQGFGRDLQTRSGKGID